MVSRPAPIAVRFALTSLLLLAIAACGGSDLTLPNAGTPAEIKILRGNEQTGPPGTMLPDSILVQVTDSAGTPLAGQRIQFVADAPGSAVAPPTATTNDQGIAGARWVLGSSTGSQELVARVIGEGVSLQVTFSASAMPGLPSVPGLAILTQPSTSAKLGERLDRQPVVQIQDPAGTDLAIGGVAVTVAIASGGGTLGGTTTRLTEANGRVEFTDLRIEATAGSTVLIFAAPGYTSVLSDAIEVGPGDNPAGDQPPIAGNDEYNTIEGANHTLSVKAASGVLQNDRDPEGAPLTASNASDPPHGRVKLDSRGSFKYTPDPDFFGDDQFVYRVSDPAGNSSTATVTIHVAPVNDPPAFSLSIDHVVISRDAGPQVVSGFVANLTPGADNETDQTLEFLVVGNDHPELFAAQPAITRDGTQGSTATLRFTPASGQTGTARVTVLLRDSGGTANGGKDTSSPRTFRISIH